MHSFLYRILRKIKILPQKTFVKLHYKYQTGKTLNLNDPKDFNEKIQWLKVFYKPAILTQLVDKYDVRSYVSERVGDRYLNEVYGVYEHAAAIDFDTLPNKFVLKATHGYDMNMIVKDKTKLNISKVREITERWLAINHYHHAGKEWAYKNVKPRLLIEKFMKEEGKDHINDYKFFCFNGTPKFLQVDLDRGGKHAVGYYDLEWKRLPFVKKGNFIAEENIAKPENFEEMLAVVGKLAADFPFVRVDVYNIGGKIIFGEMTFYPADGRAQFQPEEYNRLLGDYIKLPQIPKGKKAITKRSKLAYQLNVVR